MDVNEIRPATLDPEGSPQRVLAAQVLVVGPDDWAVRDGVDQLLEAGRAVHRCSDSAEVPFPCNAMVPGRGCPLDRHKVDVVVNIRLSPGDRPSQAEMGAICGLRDHIPLVVAGMTEMSPFAPYADAVPVSGDLVFTCDEAVRRRR